MSVKNRIFLLFLRQKGTRIGQFGTRDDPIIRIRKLFEDLGLQRPVRLQRLMRSMRLQRFLKAQKSLLKTSESSRFLNSAYFDVQKNKVFLQNHEISGLILITFLLEAVEASLCYFFKNWLMKHKSPNLLKPLGTIIHQNSQFYYPSEPFSFHHFNVRHPVQRQSTFLNLNLNYMFLSAWSSD